MPWPGGRGPWGRAPGSSLLRWRTRAVVSNTHTPQIFGARVAASSLHTKVSVANKAGKSTLLHAAAARFLSQCGPSPYRPLGSRTSQFSRTVCTSCPLRGSRSRTFTSSLPPVGFLPSSTSTISLISHSFSSRSSFR